MRLAAFQDAFAAALAADEPRSALPQLGAQPGFAVYRNTVMKGCIDALQANYPAVERLVGEEWFRAAAAVYARAEPPAHASLLDYGA
ncbi:MAG: DNA-binding domain-containing protein, partial [Pseudomonadota bacterium]